MNPLIQLKIITLPLLVSIAQKGGMKARLIAPVIALLCTFSVAVEAGQIQVSDGPTPFIRFVHTRVDNVASFTFAQFQILPKTGSATRPIQVRYARSYLEAHGYFDSTNGNLTVPVFGLYAGRPNSVIINLGFGSGFRQNKRFAVTITTPAYNGGTYSNPTVIQPRLPGTTLSYDFILLKNYANPITPIIIDTEPKSAGLAPQEWSPEQHSLRQCILCYLWYLAPSH